MLPLFGEYTWQHVYHLKRQNSSDNSICCWINRRVLSILPLCSIPEQNKQFLINLQNVMEEISSDVTESASISIFSEVLPSSPANLRASVSPIQSYKKKKGELTSNFQKDALMSNAKIRIKFLATTLQKNWEVWGEREHIPSPVPPPLQVILPIPGPSSQPGPSVLPVMLDTETKHLHENTHWLSY